MARTTANCHESTTRVYSVPDHEIKLLFQELLDELGYEIRVLKDYGKTEYSLRKVNNKKD